MKNEADVKRKMVQSMKDHRGYGRRIEDQYGVGIFDLILIPYSLPVFMAEVKIIKGAAFGPTPRQEEELRRIKEVGSYNGHVIPVMIGYRDGVYYFHAPQDVIYPNDCFSVTTSDMSFHDQLVQYYHSRRK